MGVGRKYFHGKERELINIILLFLERGKSKSCTVKYHNIY